MQEDDYELGLVWIPLALQAGSFAVDRQPASLAAKFISGFVASHYAIEFADKFSTDTMHLATKPARPATLQCMYMYSVSTRTQ